MNLVERRWEMTFTCMFKLARSVEANSELICKTGVSIHLRESPNRRRRPHASRRHSQRATYPPRPPWRRTGLELSLERGRIDIYTAGRRGTPVERTRNSVYRSSWETLTAHRARPAIQRTRHWDRGRALIMDALGGGGKSLLYALTLMRGLNR